MCPTVPAFGGIRAAIIVGGLAAITLTGTAPAQSPQPASATMRASVTGHNLIAVDYSADGPIGGESLSVGPDRLAQIQAHNRFHRPMQRNVTVKMSPAQFHRMLLLVNDAGLAQLPAHVGRRIMDGAVITVSVSYSDSKHQAQTVTVLGGDPAFGGLSQLQTFLSGFLNEYLK